MMKTLFKHADCFASQILQMKTKPVMEKEKATPEKWKTKVITFLQLCFHVLFYAINKLKKTVKVIY